MLELPVQRSTIQAVVLIAVFALVHRGEAQSYDGYCLYLGGYPIAETSWSNDVQGVAHDDNNWFITTTEQIFKIPVGLDLRTVTYPGPGVDLRLLQNYPQLVGFHHNGDPVVYKFNGVDYLLLPIEGPSEQGSVAVLRCSDLSYIDHAALVQQSNDAGWCAVDTDGFLYSSRQHTTGMFKYSVDWSRLQNQGILSITYLGSNAFYNEQGQFLDLVTMQGGEFAPGGELLFIISGFYDDSDGLEDREGIHMFRRFTETNGNTGWRREQHSTRGFGYFDFYYDPGFPTYEEPEGLTIWDLDDGRAPGIGGQLHALVSDNDLDAGDVDFKHYTSIIRVNPANGGTQTGTPSQPFRTLAGAVNLAWDSSEIRLRAGSYWETMQINRRVRLTTEGGVVRIGGP